MLPPPALPRRPSLHPGITRLVADLRTRYALDGKREEKVTAPIHRQYALAFG